MLVLPLNHVGKRGPGRQWINLILTDSYREENSLMRYIMIASADGIALFGFEISGPRLNINTVLPMYGDSQVKDKTDARPSYL